MKYAIVYHSNTGNTEILARQIEAFYRTAGLPGAECIYCGPPEGRAPDAELIFIGFWTDKGSCDGEIADFMKGLQDKRVFLFGTAGFGGSGEYFRQILSRVRQALPSSNTVAGAFMCQGKMPRSIRSRYEQLLPEEPVKMKGLIENYDRALSHPDESDLEELRAVLTSLTELFHE